MKIKPLRAGFSRLLSSKHLEANKKGSRCVKRVGYIYEKVCEIDNIKQAIMKASRGKRNERRIQRVIQNIDAAAREIQAMLLNQSYVPSPYVIASIYDGANKKERVIQKPRFYPDQVIHWALMLQLEPILMRGMYEYNCGSIPGRGTSFGHKTVRRWLDTDYKGTKYCLSLDVSKFYPSVDNDTLKAMFRRKLKDSNCLWLIDTIIDSIKGLPIGNFTSPWFSNFYLEGLDRFIKQNLGVKYYVRYADDMVLLGSNKKQLHRARKEIALYLQNLKLTVKGNWQVFKVDARAIDFLGFRFFRTKTILRKRNALRIRRRFLKISKKKWLNYKDASAVISYWGWIKRSDSYSFYNSKLKPLVDINRARKVVSNHGKFGSYTKARNLRTSSSV